ncbi:MAG: hypothetical protein K2H18_02140 [Muribaculaceae bacterium]|nr:hypothetical protein [Muribaculaceae bacterium]
MSSTNTRRKKTKLKVTFSDGASILEKTSFETYVKALETIGLDKVNKIAQKYPIQRRGLPFVTQTPSDKLDNERVLKYVEVKGFYIMKGLNNNTQCQFLKYVSDELDLGLIPEIESV